jgi:hypothetical protein
MNELDKVDGGMPVPTQRPIPLAMPPPGTLARPRRRRGAALFLIALALLVCGLLFGRQWVDSLLDRWDRGRAVHPDETVADTGVRPQVVPSVALVVRDQGGQRVQVLVAAERYSAFVRTQVAALEQRRMLAGEAVRVDLEGRLQPLFEQLQRRVARFADWYFAYDTTYRLVWEGAVSATSHAFALEAQGLREAVAQDLEDYLRRNYEQIVLKPEQTDPQLREAFRQGFEGAHLAYLEALAGVAADFQGFVARETSHVAPLAGQPRLLVDWESQFHKLSLGEYEKGSLEAMRGAALAALGGGVAAKAAAGAAGKAALAKGAGAAAGKGLLAKLASPFVSKAMVAGGGAAAGAVAAGPLGAAAGVGVGLGVDYLVNEGVELAQREEFEADLAETLAATRQAWLQQMTLALQQAVDVWYGDALHLLPAFDPQP